MPENLFEKIDKQSKTLDEVASKLEGVSVEDLYALAKRTWDYKDFSMAQKYYNHISLLRPLDWEAPFRASLCGCLEMTEVAKWEYRPEAVLRYYESTVAHIQKCNIDEEEKNKDILQVIDITFDIWREYIRLYLIPEHKTSFDRFCPNFKRELQKAFIAFIKNLDEYSAAVFRIKQTEFCKTLADFLSDYCCKDYSIAIEKEDLEKYVLPYRGDICLEKRIENAAIPREQEKEIKLKGKCYLVYKDKVIENRARKKSIVFAILLIIATCFTTIVPLVESKGQWTAWTALLYLPIIMYFLHRGFGKKKGIKQDSLWNSNRWKYRLTSEGEIICESVFAPMRIVSTIILCLLFPNILLIITLISYTLEAQYPMVLCVLLALSYVLEFVCLLAFGIVNTKILSQFDFIRKIEYEGKTYLFNK